MSSGTVRTSQQCDHDLVINGNLIVLFSDHILLQLFCDVTAEAVASAVGWRVHTGHVHTARDLVPRHIHCIRVKPEDIHC